MFLPTTIDEMKSLGWDSLDVIIVSGDTYIDSPYNGAAIIGHWLVDNGFKVGIIAQPDISSDDDISRLGQPNIFWSVTSGSVDSMVANYTPTNKFRKDDDFTPGGINNRRPDRACIAYCNLIKKHMNGKPIVLGGVEASLRRITHYDFWSDSLRRSILLDSKADFITYGMAERSNLLLAQYLRDGRDWTTVKGICYMGKKPPEDFIRLPSHEDCIENSSKFLRMFKTFHKYSEPSSKKGLYQQNGDRYLIQNPPYPLPDTKLLDRFYDLPYENAVHPFYAKQGFVKAMDTIKNSITTHRGCYGGCAFCSIAIMQGRTVISRSEDSIIKEAERIASSEGFDGVIRDVGGPTANMYGFECQKKLKEGVCLNKSCMYPKICDSLPIDHSNQMSLLKKISNIPGVKKVFVASGIRYDLINHDIEHGEEYLRQLIRDNHISGQMKVAPEHISDEVLKHMFKPGKDELIEFKEKFDRIKSEENKELYLTYYLMAAHPGCHDRNMDELSKFCRFVLKTIPEQIQIFTPTPSTPSTAMYYTRRDWDDRNNIKSEHGMQMKQLQKDIVLGEKSFTDSGNRNSHNKENGRRDNERRRNDTRPRNRSFNNNERHFENNKNRLSKPSYRNNSDSSIESDNKDGERKSYDKPYRNDNNRPRNNYNNNRTDKFTKKDSDGKKRDFVKKSDNNSDFRYNQHRENGKHYAKTDGVRDSDGNRRNYQENGKHFSKDNSNDRRPHSSGRSYGGKPDQRYGRNDNKSFSKSNNSTHRFSTNPKSGDGRRNSYNNQETKSNQSTGNKQYKKKR